MFLKSVLGALALALICASSPRAEAEPRIALVIGNSHYTSEIGVLPNPVNDARLIAKTLKQVGFQIISVEDADHAQLNRAISALPALIGKAGPETAALVYYAGKGVQIEGRTYMLPIDASWKGPLAVDQQGVAVDTVLSAMATAKTRILIFDASRRQPPTLAEETLEPGPPPPLTEAEARPGTIIAFAAAPGGIAVDGKGANGPYAVAMSRAILTPGLTSNDVLRQVRIDVINATEEIQIPWDSSSLIDHFYFLPK